MLDLAPNRVLAVVAMSLIVTEIRDGGGESAEPSRWTADVEELDTAPSILELLSCVGTLQLIRTRLHAAPHLILEPCHADEMMMRKGGLEC